MERLSALYARLLTWLALAACALLFLMMLMICSDVLLRNVRLIPGVQGISWSNEVSEYMLYFITMLAAPWLLRQGQHIRVDIVLRVLPPRLAWYSEWLSDLLALACCSAMALYGLRAVLSSIRIDSMTVKSLAIPEWWLLAPLPAAFLLLGIEVLFRMHRLYTGERGARADAVSAA